MTKRVRKFAIALSLLVLCFGLVPTGESVHAAQSGALSSTTPNSGLSKCAPDAFQDSGAVYRICMPPDWWYNDELIIWAHGYVDATRPIEIPEDQLCLGNTCIPDIVNALGFGFITTSYSVNALAVRQGMEDILDLVDIYSAKKGTPSRVFILGASEGGLISTLLVEQHPETFDGGLAMCGPIGDFSKQINYFGDFRSVFDVFFPGLLPESPVDVPQWLVQNWDFYYSNVIAPVIYDKTHKSSLLQLIKVSGIPYDKNAFQESLQISIHDALWYNVFATNDATLKLGGQPYDNQSAVYSGSFDDALLNQKVRRFTADQAALEDIEEHYQTTGILSSPLVTLHTTLDQQVPYWHEKLYRQKVLANGSESLHVNIPIQRFEHCNFKIEETLVAFLTMYSMATGESLDLKWMEQLLPNESSRIAFRSMLNVNQPAF